MMQQLDVLNTALTPPEARFERALRKAQDDREKGDLLDCEVRVVYDWSPGCPQTFDCPGESAHPEIASIRLHTPGGRVFELDGAGLLEWVEGEIHKTMEVAR